MNPTSHCVGPTWPHHILRVRVHMANMHPIMLVMHTYINIHILLIFFWQTIVLCEPCCLCSGLVDPSELLANIEAEIVKAKEEAVSRKEIMDRIDRWLSACEEENWLEDYNQVSWKLCCFSVSLC